MPIFIWHCILDNARHLAPYRNGNEIPLPPQPASRHHRRLRLHRNQPPARPDDTFTFLSDAVVEAQSPTGELFGFDRTRAISSQSAQSIADVAQRFGQEGDITVLTLQFAPVEALHV
jgi:sigma-B regulation protein RsbU (phosphoserine phosphatase)